MRVTKKKTSVHLSLDAEVLEQLRAVAKEECRSLSRYINRVLKRHLQDESLK